MNDWDVYQCTITKGLACFVAIIQQIHFWYVQLSSGQQCFIGMNHTISAIYIFRQSAIKYAFQIAQVVGQSVSSYSNIIFLTLVMKLVKWNGEIIDKTKNKQRDRERER